MNEENSIETKEQKDNGTETSHEKNLEVTEKTAENSPTSNNEETVAESNDVANDKSVEDSTIVSNEATPQVEGNAPTMDKASQTSKQTKGNSGQKRRRRKKELSESDRETILNLKKGQHMVGTVKNITEFGAFVDLGIAQDGLVHVSQLSKRKVENPSDVVSEGQQVDVWVKKVDKKRGRISLTMIKPVALRLRDIKDEDELEGVVTRLEAYGAFVDISSEREGLVHISEITHEYINHPEEVLSIDEKVKIKVLKVDYKKRQIDLSIKALLPPPPKEESKPPPQIDAKYTTPPPQRTTSKDKSRSRDKGRKSRGKSFFTEKIEYSNADQPMMTAMAAAFSAFQSDTAEETEKTKSVKKQDKSQDGLDSIIERTLSNN